MNEIFRALADPTIRGWYLGACFGVLVLPPVAMAWWYHARIGKTPGGRRLMQAHADIGVPSRTNPVGALHALWRALTLARDVSAARDDDPARRLQAGVYWMSGAWLVANIVLFGIVILADAVNRAAT
jgi:hypothetical protein